MTRTNRVLILSVLLAIACLAGALTRLPAVLAPLAWFGALWLPGSALSIRRFRPENQHASALDPLWLPLASGPVLFGVGITLGRLLGISLAPTAAATVLLGFVALVLRLCPWKRPRPAAAPHASETPRQEDSALPSATSSLLPGALPPSPSWHRFLPAAAVLAILLLGALPPLLHQPLRLQADARLHLPIVQRILAGSFPPENPFLAGVPVAYFWFYHVVLAGTARLTHLPLDLIPALLSTQALLVLLLAVNRLGRRLGLTPVARAAGVAFIGLGLTPWGWIQLLVVHLTDPEINWALARAYGVSALLPLLSPADPRLAASLTKVAVTNALPMSLALLVLAATPPREGSPGGWIRRGVYTAGSLLFHIAAGGLLVAGLATSWLVVRFLPPRDSKNRVSGSWPALLTLALAAAATAPYLLDVLAARTGNSATTVTWNGRHAIGLHATLAGMWLLALPALRRWLRESRGRAWLAVGIPALALPWFVHLVDGNEYKTIFVLLVLLAPVAGAGLARLARGRLWIAALVLLLFIPTPLLVARAYLRDVPPGLLSPRERDQVERIGASLPPNAMLWKIDPGRDYSVLTLPLGRTSYLSDPYALRILGQWNSDEARWRRGSLQLARRGRIRAALQAAAERVHGRPLYAIVTRNDAVRFPRLARGLPRLGCRRVASLPRFTLYEVPSRWRSPRPSPP